MAKAIISNSNYVVCFIDDEETLVTETDTALVTDNTTFLTSEFTLVDVPTDSEVDVALFATTIIDGVIEEFIPETEEEEVKKTTFTFNQFADLFLTTELMAIYSSTDALVQIFLDRLRTANYINIEDERMIAGIEYLYSTLGLISEDTYNNILG